jgi:hypothetical protein
MPTFKQLLFWTGIALIVWFIIEEPTTAAHVVHNIGTFLSTAARGVSTFVSSI